MSDQPRSVVEESLEELYEHAPCGYVSTQPDGTITKINTTLLTWLGRERDDVVGQPFQNLLTVPGRIYYDTHYQPLLAMQGFVREIAFELARESAPPLPVMVTTTARRDAAGKILHFRTTVFDVSTRRGYERELLRQRQRAEQAATSRSALLAMLSHDVRSPLSSVLMALERLDGPTTETERSKYLAIIRRASENVLQLVQSILEHSKLEAGASTWQADPTDLRELAMDIAEVQAVAAERKHVDLRTTIDPRLPPLLLADRFKLGQIITNLVSNALKFTERGQVELALRVVGVAAHDATIELRVTDTGIGIPPDKLSVIFDEFRQVSDTARRYGGTGLGLAITRRLLALIGGLIEVKSTVGEGSTFTCTLRLPTVAPPGVE